MSTVEMIATPVARNQSKVSAVIATIGNISILETIKSLQSGSSRPDEIIVIIPEHNRDAVSYLQGLDVDVKFTSFFGQVRQRNYGVALAKNDTILQVDDDVLLDQDCLKNLIEIYEASGRRVAVGPQFRYFDGETAWPIRSIIYQVLSTIIWGSKSGVKRFGTINSIGCGHGVDFLHIKDTYKKVNWLSGGCVLLHKESRPKELHFPFVGKAYCEDLMQSILQAKEGVIHICTSSAVCFIQKEQLTRHNYNLNSDFIARKYVLDLLGKSKIRLYFWYVLKKITGS